MSYDANVTVMGRIGSEPRFFMAEGEAPDFVSFRLATTRSYFNRNTGAWVDGETTWFTVKAWRTLATNIRTSLKKGDAVIVHGNLDTQRWTSSEGIERESLVIEAQAVGPNLLRGVSKFRSLNPNAAASSPNSAANAAASWPAPPANSVSQRNELSAAVDSMVAKDSGEFVPSGSDSNGVEDQVNDAFAHFSGATDGGDVDESLTMSETNEHKEVLTA